MDPDSQLPLLKVKIGELAQAALVVGDPERAKAAAGHLTDGKQIGNFREYLTYTGTHQGRQLTIASHGVGASGASICFEELIQGGVKTIIRAGTCGAMAQGIRDGETIIGTGAIRNDGTSDKLLPMSYPAIADRHVVAALEAATIERSGPTVHTGIVLTQANFYDGKLPSPVGFWLNAKMNVCAVEMEFATLLIIASMHGVRAGGIFVSDGNMTKESDPTAYDPHRRAVKEGVEKMIPIGLDALASLL